MKGVKGKIIKRLKTIQALGSLKQGLVFHVVNSNHHSLDDNNTYISKEIISNNNNVGGVVEHDKLKDDILSTTPMGDHHDDETEDHDHGHDDLDHHEITNSSVSLSDFEHKCPPGGSDKVILYTTSLRGIRKTFEDCGAVRFLLESYKVSFLERDVSLHKEFREELWAMFDGDKVVPPRLFIKERYIGGADEVVGGLNEQGKLTKLLEGIPRVAPNNSRCVGCANMRFLVCTKCNGSRKVLKQGDSAEELNCYTRCPECNENGLVKCNVCC